MHNEKFKSKKMQQKTNKKYDKKGGNKVNKELEKQNKIMQNWRKNRKINN